jgi:Acyl-CoA dehydrogenase, N-terminal domain
LEFSIDPGNVGWAKVGFNQVPQRDIMNEHEEQAFRQRIQTFIAENSPDLPHRVGTRSPEDLHESTILREWSRQIYAAGFEGGNWPEEFGGNASSYDAVEEMLVTEEFARAKASMPRTHCCILEPRINKPSTFRKFEAMNTYGASSSASLTQGAIWPRCAQRLLVTGIALS